MGTADIRTRRVSGKRPLTEYRDSALWSAVEAIFAELKATDEIAVNTAPDYVIAYACRELIAKKIVTEAALLDRRDADAS
jgi:hypothetical protein